MLEFALLYLLFLTSVVGAFALFGGVVTFFLLPIIPKITGIGKRIGRTYVWLSLWCLKRAALVVSEHGELLLKPMRFDDLGVEQIAFGEDTKDFEDPDAALSNWMGFPFALADEESGVLFDPRHAAIAERKRDLDERNIGPVLASESDWEAHRIHEWVPGVFELSGKHELVDLTAINHLIDGGERAEYPARTENIYRLSRKVLLGSKYKSLRILVPVLAFCVSLFTVVYVGDTYGGGGGPDQIIGFGSVLLALAIPSARRVGRVIAGLLVAVGVAAIVGYGLLVNPLVTIFTILTFFGGLVAVPIISFLLRFSDRAAQFLSRLVYLKLGLLAFERPVLVWTDRGYRLREHASLDSVCQNRVRWFALAGSYIGFAFEPDPNNFEPEYIPPNELDSMGEVTLPDGGAEETNIPAGFTRAPTLKRQVYGGFIPESIDGDRLYVNSGIALSKFNASADGERSMRRLLRAKEQYGEQASLLSDRSLLWATLGAMLLGSIMGVVLLFV